MVALPSPRAWADPASEDELIELINRARAARGLARVAPEIDLMDSAATHSGTMAGAGAIFHGASVTTTVSWQTMAENVGRGATVRAVHDAFMASEPHRANLLGDYNYVGVGISWRGSYVYVTMLFMRASGTVVTPPFWDDDHSVHEPDIVRLWKAGVTNGCGPGRYCPDRPVTRAEMAAFLVRALGLPATSRDYFDDDRGNLFESEINALAEAGITSGCRPGAYCPLDPVTRGQMASFLSRILDR